MAQPVSTTSNLLWLIKFVDNNDSENGKRDLKVKINKISQVLKLWTVCNKKCVYE